MIISTSSILSASDISVAVSRRDFLKMIGAGAGIFVFGSMGGLALLAGSKKAGLVNEASAATAGSWSPGSDTSTVAIHASILPNGKIFYMAGSGYHTSH